MYYGEKTASSVNDSGEGNWTVVCKIMKLGDFLDGSVVKNMLCNAGNMVSIPGW